MAWAFDEKAISRISRFPFGIEKNLDKGNRKWTMITSDALVSLPLLPEILDVKKIMTIGCPWVLPGSLARPGRDDRPSIHQTDYDCIFFSQDSWEAPNRTMVFTMAIF
jgi:hypothetical protein